MTERNLGAEGAVTTRRDVLPVLLGGDIGIYALARSFHEAFGSRALVLSAAPIQMIALSSFIDVLPLPQHPTDADMLAALEDVATRHPGRSLVLMANHDVHSVFVARHREALTRAGYALPFPSLEVIENLTDKASFTRVCTELGIDTPGTVTVDFAESTTSHWSAPQIPFDFPVVAKAARSDEYNAVRFAGKKKIWFIESAQELDALWQRLREAGYRGTFLVQELIPGDNTQMRSITAYVDSHGRVTLMGSARVLLEDHAPTMIGNPVAMITERFPRLWEQAERILLAAGYRGFANFDVKIDPRDGRAVFFEVNPRIGRNSWYMTAAGANPMPVMVDDLVNGVTRERVDLDGEVLYSLVPTSLLRRYVRDKSLLATVNRLVRAGRCLDPLEYRAERSLRYRVLVALQKANHHRKFRRYYPTVTDRSF